MSKPSVKVKDKEYSVSQISVILKLNSGPLIYLRLSEKLDGTEAKISNEETFKQEFFADIFSEAEGSFAWGDTLKFFLVGYNSLEDRTFELVGLVVKKDLTEWFNQNNFKDKKEDYLIYQKGKGKNSWSFFNMVLENKFKQPNQDFINKTDLLFPDNGCIWRYKDSNNFHFLNRAIAFASRHLPQVQGWCGFDDSKPLRLIIFEEKKQDKTIPKLDNTWAASSYPFVPNRYSWNRWLDKSSTLTRELSIQEGQEMALIKKLTSHGLNDEDGKSYQAQNPTQLLFSPGTITIGKKNIFCHTVTYEFKLPAFGEESPSVTMKIEVDYPERQIGDNEIVSLRLPGKFKEWHQKKDGETEVKIAPDELKNWGIINEKDQSLKSGDDAVLSTHILSRTYSDKKYSGIYIKHEKGDEMIVDIHPCSIPLVLGSVQKYRKELEQADVTLSGEKLAISVSEHHQSLDKSEAIILDSSEIKLNHGKKIFGQAQQKVDFLSQNIELGSSRVNINSANTQIKSLVNISFPAPKVPTPNIPSSSGVGEVASNKVGETKKNSPDSGSNSSSLGSNNSSRTADALEQPAVNAFGMDESEPMNVDSPDEVDRLADQFSKMSLHDKVNTFGLDDNCYYCTAAALLNMTVDELITKSEIMQYATGTLEDITDLFKEVGVPVKYQTIDKDRLESEIEKLQNNDRFGFAYHRQDGSGHMVVLQKNQHSEASISDYQKDPVVNKSFQEFLTQENITTAYVFSPSTTGAPTNVAGGAFGTYLKTDSKSKAEEYEKKDGGHSLARHGPGISYDDLKKRLTTGIAPDGKISPTPASTRFNNYEDWLQTRQDAMNAIAEREKINLTKPPPHGKEGPFRITIDHRRAIDDGFVGDGGKKIKISDPSTGKKKNIKVFASQKKVDNLTRTTTSIQWNEKSKNWDVKQHFPDAQNWDQEKQIYTNKIA